MIEYQYKFKSSSREKVDSCTEMLQEEYENGNDNDTENSGSSCRTGPVEAGQLIEADLDLVLGNDITSPVAIHEMDKMTVDTVFNKDKIALVMDHFIPNKDIKSAEHCKCVESLPVVMISPIILMWDRWELSMRCFRRKVLRLQVT